ncbi:MAG: beta strand repeat-containing protein, partial [Akkermansiaceae bacterium]
MSKTHSRRAHSLSFAGITAILCLLALPEARGQNEYNWQQGGDLDGSATWLDYDSDGNSLGTYSRLGERVFTNTGYQYRAAATLNTNGDYTASSNPSTLLYDYNLDVSRDGILNIGHDLSTSATDTNTGQLSVGGEVSGGTINHTAGTLTTGTLLIGDYLTVSSLWPEISEYHISGTADIDASSIIIERGRLFVGDGVTLDESITVTGSSIEGSGTTTGGTLTGQITLDTGSTLKRFTGNNMTLSGGIVSSNDQDLVIEGKNYTIDTNAINLNGGTMLFWGADNDKANATQLNVAGNNWELALITRGGYLLAGAENVMDSGAGLKFGQYFPLVLSYDTYGVNGSGTFDLNGYDQTVAYLQSSHAGDDHTITNTSGNGATLTVDYSGTDQMEYYGRFEGDVGLTKEGSGKLVLANQSGTDSSHTGVIRINGGTLEISSNDALGSTAAGTIIGDAELRFASGSGLTIDENITSSGSGQSTIRAGINHVINGLITLNAGMTLIGSTSTSSQRATYNGGVTSLDQDLAISNAVINSVIDLDSDNSGAAGNLIIPQGGTPILAVGGHKVGALQFTSTAADIDQTTRLTIQTAEKILQGSAGIEVVGAQDRSIIMDLNGFDQTIHHISVDAVAPYFWVSSPSSSPATLTFNAEDDRQYRGHFDNAVNITKEGAGTLHFSSSYNGNLQTDGVIRVNEGTLKIDSAHHLGTTDGETIIANGATLSADGGISDNVINDGTITLTGDRSSSPKTVSGAISGSGSLVKTSGQSAYTLTGVNTYTGGTWVESNGGELRGTTDSLQGAIYNSGAVGILQDFDGTFNGTVTGTGSFRIQGGVGTNPIITLNGNLTHTGGTTLTRGTLVVTTDNLPQNITTAAGTIRYDQDFDGTYSGVIDGHDTYNPGSVEKYGTGTVTFAAKQNYTGSTTVNEGTLRIIKSATADGTLVEHWDQDWEYIVAEGATLEFNQTGGTSGLGLINVSGNGTFKTSGTVQLVHTSAGSSVALGSGALFHVESGIYRFGGGGLGDWSSNLSDMQIDSGATFDGAGTPTIVDSLNGAGTLKTGGGITFGADNGDGTFSGNIQNSSYGSAKSLTKTGTGTQILNGTANHTGTTTVNEGTLSLGSGYSHNGGGAFVVNAAGTLEGTTDNLQGAAITNNGNVRLNQSTDGTYSDAMSGTGSLEKSGTGTLILSGTNTYSGATTVNAGTLRMINSASGDGINGNTASAINYSVASGATLEFSRTGGTLGIGKIDLSGGGTFKKTGSEEISHTSADSTVALGSGALFHVEAGTYRFGGGTAGTWSSNLSDLQIDSGATFNGAATSIVVDSLNGAGSLKTGGGITVGADNGGGTFSGNIENSGYGSTFSFTKNGTGTQTLSGTSTYSGGTTVNGGTLAGTTDSLQGAIANDANVRFDQSTD